MSCTCGPCVEAGKKAEDAVFETDEEFYKHLEKTHPNLPAGPWLRYTAEDAAETKAKKPRGKK